MLTRKQHELLVFIDRHLRTSGFSPSFEEMKEALQLKSKSGVHRLISALEERGFLRRRHHRARALEVVRLPAEATPRGPAAAKAETTGFSPNVIRGDFTARLPGVRAAGEAGAVQIPLYGRIAAACRSRRSGIREARSRCRSRCLGVASTTRSRLRVTPWSMRAFWMAIRR